MTFVQKRFGTLSLFVTIALMVLCALGAFFLFSGAHAQQASQTQTVCLDDPVPAGTVITRYLFSAQCPGIGDNAFQVTAPQDGLRICVNSPRPEGYVITRYTSSSNCDTDENGLFDNQVTINLPYDLIRVCQGSPVPGEYEVIQTATDFTRCPGGSNNIEVLGLRTLPDVVVRDTQLFQSPAGFVRFGATAQNLASQVTRDFDLEYSINGGSFGLLARCTPSSFLGNKTCEGLLGSRLAPQVSHSVTFCVDRAENLREQNENNNCATEMIVPVAGDLVFSQLPALDSADVVVGIPNGVSFSMTNQGDADIPDFFLTITINGQEIVLNQSGLDIGESRQIAFPWTPETAGAGQIEVHLDPSDVIVENNEGNNLSTIAFTAVEPAALDLSVDALSIIADPVVGLPNEINFTIGNYGAQQSPAFTVTVSTPEGNIVLSGQSPLGANDSGNNVRSFSVPWNPEIPGNHTLSVMVTSPGNEQNTENNQRSLPITSEARADLVIDQSSIRITPLVPQEGDDVTITVGMKNIGLAPVGASVRPRVKITGMGETSVPECTSAIAVGGICEVSYTFENVSAGSHSLSLVADPTPLDVVDEMHEDNNERPHFFIVESGSSPDVTCTGNWFLSGIGHTHSASGQGSISDGCSLNWSGNQSAGCSGSEYYTHGVNGMTSTWHTIAPHPTTGQMCPTRVTVDAGPEWGIFEYLVTITP